METIKLITISIVIAMSVSGAVWASETVVSFPDLAFKCNYANCKIGSGKRSCQLTDANGGLVTVNGVSPGQCNIFSNKVIVWENAGRNIKSKIISTKEIANW